MKFQQEIARFLESTIILSCRMCHANKNTRDNMKFDIVENERYHHKTLNIRTNYAHMSKSVKKDHLKQYDITIKFFALQALTLALNIISSRSNDSTHSEFANIVRRIMSHFLK